MNIGARAKELARKNRANLLTMSHEDLAEALLSPSGDEDLRSDFLVEFLMYSWLLAHGPAWYNDKDNERRIREVFQRCTDREECNLEMSSSVLSWLAQQTRQPSFDAPAWLDNVPQSAGQRIRRLLNEWSIADGCVICVSKEYHHARPATLLPFQLIPAGMGDIQAETDEGHKIPDFESALQNAHEAVNRFLHPNTRQCFSLRFPTFLGRPAEIFTGASIGLPLLAALYGRQKRIPIRCKNPLAQVLTGVIRPEGSLMKTGLIEDDTKRKISFLISIRIQRIIVPGKSGSHDSVTQWPTETSIKTYLDELLERSWQPIAAGKQRCPPMTRTGKTECLNHILQQMPSLLADVKILPEHEKLVHQIESLQKDLEEAKDTLTNAPQSERNDWCASENLCHVGEQLQSENVLAIFEEPTWVKNLGSVAKSDFKALANIVGSLRNELQDIADWGQVPLSHLKMGIEQDLDTFSELALLPPSYARVRCFLAIRVIEAGICFLKLARGEKLDKITTSDTSRISSRGFAIDNLLLNDFPALSNVFGLTMPQVDGERSHIVHVEVLDGPQVPEHTWMFWMLSVWRLIWREGAMAEALKQINEKWTEYKSSIKQRIHSADILKQGTEAIRKKQSELAPNDPMFQKGDGDDIVNLCANEKGAFLHFGGDNASIHWHVGAPPYMTMFAIRNEWKSQNWEQGPLGYPTSDEKDIEENDYLEVLEQLGRKPGRWLHLKSWRPWFLKKVRFGKYTDFEKGRIYWFEERWRKETGCETAPRNKNGAPLQIAFLK